MNIEYWKSILQWMHAEVLKVALLSLGFQHGLVVIGFFNRLHTLVFVSQR